jgi:MFS family permease
MNDLIIVFVGLALILYIFFVLGTARIAVTRSKNGIGWFLFSLILPPIAFLGALRLPKADIKKESADNSFFENIVMDLTQPFIDLAGTSQALLGLNISYVLEGLTYFGVLGLLAIYFNEYVGLDDIRAGNMLGILTGGITLAMLFLGATVDWIGLRKALLIALVLMLVGRILITIAPEVGVSGIWNSAHIFSMLGILGIVLGYGIYQPACYAGVKQLTTEKTAAMGYAMLYALMNLGGFLPGIISPPVRKSFGITGVFWVYAVLTVVGIAVVYFVISKKAVKKAQQEQEASEPESSNVKSDEEEQGGFKLLLNVFLDKVKSNRTPAMSAGVFLIAVLFLAIGKEFIFTSAVMEINNSGTWYSYLFSFNWFYLLGVFMLCGFILFITDLRFFYFVFILIFVQTLFAHNWLTLPMYTSRAFEGFVGDNFEFFVNLNPILIFILTPMVTALTSKKDTYNMMILGTFVMAAPTFILVLGPNFNTLIAYLVLMTIGEAMWQPRFLQWVAEIAPKGMTGVYMGIGQFPWFLTKVITSLYSGWFLMNYVPQDTPVSELNSETMWFFYALIAMVSPIGLVLAKGWMKKGFKTKHEG